MFGSRRKKVNYTPSISAWLLADVRGALQGPWGAWGIALMTWQHSVNAKGSLNEGEVRVAQQVADTWGV